MSVPLTGGGDELVKIVGKGYGRRGQCVSVFIEYEDGGRESLDAGDIESHVRKNLPPAEVQ